MAKVVVQANEIRTNDGERLVIDNLVGYKEYRDYTELDDLDFVDKYHLRTVAAPAPNPILLNLSAGQNVPVTYTPVPEAFQAAVQITVEDKTTGRLIWDADIRIIRDATSGLITAIELYGHPDGGTPNKNIDAMIVVISRA